MLDLDYSGISKLNVELHNIVTLANKVDKVIRICVTLISIGFVHGIVSFINTCCQLCSDSSAVSAHNNGVMWCKSSAVFTPILQVSNKNM